MIGLKFRRTMSIQERWVISVCAFVEKVVCSKNAVNLLTYLRDVVWKMPVLHHGKAEDGRMVSLINIYIYIYGIHH